VAAHALTDRDIIEQKHGVGIVISDDIGEHPLWAKTAYSLCPSKRLGFADCVEKLPCVFGRTLIPFSQFIDGGSDDGRADRRSGSAVL
jgi:hypothetical protein